METAYMVPGMTQARIDALAAFNALQSGIRNDALLEPGTGLWFSRQLESLVQEVFRFKTPPRNALRLFNLDTAHPEGAKTFVHRMYEHMGKAQWVNNYGDDLPRVGVAGTELARPIKTFGSSYSYTIDDIMASRMTNISLDGELARACRIANEQFLNDVAWFGDQEVGIWGALTHPYVPRTILAEPINSSASSSDAILAVLNAFLDSIDELTETTAQAAMLLLPPSQYNYINTTPRSATTDTTILEFLVDKRDEPLMVEKVWELRGGGPNGEDLCMAMPVDDRVVKHVVPMTFRQMPVQEQNLEFVVNCISKSGGFYTPYPLEVAIGEIPSS